MPEREFSVYKTDDSKRLVFGWASVSITVDGVQLEDRQSDMIDPEVLEEAAYEYVLNFRDTGEEHISTMRKKGKLVESCVFTEEKQRAIGIPAGVIPVGWWIGFRIEDDAAWEKVKNGTYRMFSIEGRATREEIQKGQRDYDEYPSYSMWLEENLDATVEEQKAAAEYYKTHKEEAKRNWKHAPASVAKTFEEILKYNPFHDARGRFTSGNGGAVTVVPGSGKATITQQKLSEANVNKNIEKVRASCGNSYDPVEKESVNMAKVKERGGCSDAEAQTAVDLADKVFETAKAHEPQITDDVVSSVAANSGQMYGLKYRMKQPTSMAGKIAADAKEDGVSMEVAASKIKDSVRYTAVFEDNDFVSGYKNVKSTLESKGYEEVRCKNFFKMYSEGTSCQKAVQCVYKNKEGVNFELQFHTYSTQGAKEVNHPFYEEQRAATTTKKRAKALNDAMTQISSYSAVPEGVLDI